MMSRIAKSIRNNMLVGLVLATPIVVTGFIINAIFKFITNRLLPKSLQGSEHDLLLRAAALLSVLVLLFLLGLFVRNIVGKKLYHFGDTVLTRIPVINKIYVSIRQISEALVAQRQTMFQEVVLVEYPRKGLYSVAFVTAAVPPEMASRLQGGKETDPWASLFIPTTPNPTSGLLIFARRSELVPLHMNVPDAMKLIISAGAAYPGTEHFDKQPSLLAKLEAWLARDAKTDKQSPA